MTAAVTQPTEGAVAQKAFGAAAGTVLALAAGLWAIGDYPGMFGECGDGDLGRAGDMRDWQRLWIYGALCSLPPLLYALRVWLHAVWPHRRTGWAVVAFAVLGLAAVVAGRAVAGGWTTPDELDWLAVLVLAPALVWVWPFVPLGFWAGLAVLALVAGAVVAVAPARRWFHALMLFLVVTGWWAIAGATLAMSEGAFAC